jgi:hypothetical protein
MDSIVCATGALIYIPVLLTPTYSPFEGVRHDRETILHCHLLLVVTASSCKRSGVNSGVSTPAWLGIAADGFPSW